MFAVQNLKMLPGSFFQALLYQRRREQTQTQSSSVQLYHTISQVKKKTKYSCQNYIVSGLLAKDMTVTTGYLVEYCQL